jgi:phosphonate transport system ATP-binding protein
LLLQAAHHATLITVVHNTALLPLLADRVLGLRQGRVVFDLPTSQVSDTVLNQLYQTS